MRRYFVQSDFMDLKCLGCITNNDSTVRLAIERLANARPYSGQVVTRKPTPRMAHSQGPDQHVALGSASDSLGAAVVRRSMAESHSRERPSLVAHHSPSYSSCACTRSACEDGLNADDHFSIETYAFAIQTYRSVRLLSTVGTKVDLEGILQSV